jgi:hypothetical protein
MHSSRACRGDDRLSSLTPIEIAAAASRSLEEANYARIAEERLGDAVGRGRFYEDTYGVVLLVVYETWVSLVEGWGNDQARLVALISAYMTRADPKSREGYLVLLCPVAPPTEEAGLLQEIRYDITRVRKLIATGEELTELADVERAILPLLPVSAPSELEPESSALDLLPDLLEEQGIDRVDSDALIEAFREQRPLLEAIHRDEAQS